MSNIFSGIGSIVGGLGNIAAGNMAAQGGQMQAAALRNEGNLDLEGAEFTATQLRQNATTAIAAAQRQAMDIRLRTAQVGSTFTAKAAGSGLSATGGTMLAEREQIVGRGEYQALSEMASGENTAVGMENEARAEIFAGEAEQYGADRSADAALYSGEMQKMAYDTKGISDFFQAGAQFAGGDNAKGGLTLGNIAAGGRAFMSMFTPPPPSLSYPSGSMG